MFKEANSALDSFSRFFGFGSSIVTMRRPSPSINLSGNLLRGEEDVLA